MMWDDACIRVEGGQRWLLIESGSLDFGEAGAIPVKDDFRWLRNGNIEEEFRHASRNLLLNRHFPIECRNNTGDRIEILNYYPNGVSNIVQEGAVTSRGGCWMPYDLIWPDLRKRPRKQCDECRGKKVVELMNFYFPCSKCHPDIKDKRMTAEEAYELR